MQETIEVMNQLKANNEEYNALLLRILLMIDNNAEQT